MKSDKEKQFVIDMPKEGEDPDRIFLILNDAIKNTFDETSVEKFQKAYTIARKLHDGQKRRSGEEYIVHPLCVAIILFNLHMDIDTIISGILHDTIEDTKYTFEDCTKDFGETVAIIVDGVTKLTKLSIENDKVERQAENLRHMFLSMSRDIRVIIVKLADRLHNLETLEYQTKEKQEEKSLETLEIYSPIANRLGISTIKSRMDDLALMYLKPKEYAELEKNMKSRHETRDAFIERIVNDVKTKLVNEGIQCEVYGRVKNLFSIYKKIVNKHKSIEEIYDLFAIRVLVNDVKDCYACLGIIHEYYIPVPGRFKDYIAMPKANKYQSLHTTVIDKDKDSTPFEIQIRTYEMHEINEYGVAAHWAYKENGGSKENKDIDELNKMAWLHDILDVDKQSNNADFLNFVKNDLDIFAEKVYCFSPQGDVITLPKGSTPVDFAYHIHSAVGNKMVGAKVNEVLVPIDYEIKNGDRINIITSQNSQGPSRDWLKIVKSAQAKNKIQRWFKQERRDDNIAYGKEAIEKYCKQHRIKVEDIFKEEYLKAVYKKYTCQTLDDVYAVIGLGGVKESQIVNRLLEEYNKENKDNITDDDVKVLIESQKKPIKSSVSHGVSVNGAEGLEVHFSRCCNPLPGDEIIGFVTRGRGITIHRTDCKNIMCLPSEEKNRLLSAEWSDINENNSYLVSINVYCINRKGLLVDVSKVFSENNIDITSVETKYTKDEKGIITLSFNVKSKDEVNIISNKLRAVKNVVDIERL